MRYGELAAMFEGLLAASRDCSREWRLSDEIVMYLEFDLFSAAARSPLTPGHSGIRHGQRRGTGYLRTGYFDRSGARVLASCLTPDEAAASARMTEHVDNWVLGAADLLPSTSTLISDRLRERR